VLTRPVRLGMALTEEATELMVLTEELLGLRFRPVGVPDDGGTFRTAVFALAGVVEGKPIRVTLCTGANRPYRGWHWKYLRGRGGGRRDTQGGGARNSQDKRQDSQDTHPCGILKVRRIAFQSQRCQLEP